MLQRNQIPPSVDLRNRAAALPSLAETFDAFLAYMRRQYWVVLGTAALCLIAGLAYVLTAAPSYTALATMIIDTRKFQVFQQQSIVNDIPIDSTAVESQVEILKSENVALSVIKDLKLNEEPEFVGTNAGVVGAVFDFVTHLFVGRAPRNEFELNRQAIRTFQRQLDIRRRGLTYVIEITFRSLDAERAAKVANSVADAYIVDQLDSKYQATRRASLWLQDRIQELRSQASTAERAVLDYKKTNNIVTAGGGKLMNEQQLGELNTQLVTVRAQVADAKAKLDRIESVVKGNAPDATVADTLNSQVVTKLRSQYLELANREADWSNRYGYNHLAAVNLRNQMREIQSSILEELKRLAESYKSDYAIALQRQKEVEGAVSESVLQSQSTNQAQVTLRELESSAQTYRSLYDNFLQRYMESVQQQSFPITEARVITRASRPLGKSHPQTLVVLALSTLGGLLLGLGIGIFRDVYDRVFRTGEMVEALLNTDCVAIVPRVPAGQNKAAANRPVVPVGPRVIQRGDDPILWAAIDSPFSRFSKSIRSIKVNADLNVTKPSKVLALTSALPNEGKSTLAFVFAQSVAQSGARVLLVDCDLRNPSLSRKVAKAADLGILDVLSKNATLHNALWKDPVTGLFFLPGATKSRIAHSHEVLGSDQMKEFVDKLRGDYDYIIVDFPPLTPVVDVRTTARFVDSYIFVVEWGKTQVQLVERALHSARAVSDNLLGVVLNKADIASMSRYSGYSGKNYYYNSHYGRYGYTE